MSYQDYLRATTSNQRPTCWGNDRSFDPSDAECSNCRFKHSCAAQIERESRDTSTPVRVNRDMAPSRRDGGEVGTHPAARLEEGERPIERFLKDAAAGALRGAFYEMYSFWRVFRFK